MNQIKKYWSIPLLLVILGVAFLLRARMFLYGDLFFLPDQGRDMQLVKQIVVDHKLTLIGGHTGGFGGLFHGPLWWYMIVPFFFISNGNPFWSLVPLYLIISLGIVVFGFLIVSQLYGKGWGMLFAALLSISHFLSTTILFTSNAQPMPLVFLFYLYCMVNYLRGRTIYFIPTMLLIALGIHFEVGFAITLIPITFFGILLSKKQPSVKIIVSGLFVFFIALSTYIVFDLRHQFLQTKSLLSLLLGHYTNTTAWDKRYFSLWFRLSDRWQSLLSLFVFPSFAEDIFSQFLAMGFVIAGILLFVYEAIKRKIDSQEKKEVIFFIGILLIAYSFYMIIKVPLQGHYTISLGVLVTLLLVLALKSIAKLSKKLCIVLLVIYLILQAVPVKNYIQTNYIHPIPYNQTSNGSYLNQLSIVDQIFKDANGKHFGYFVFDPPIVTYGIDYLMWYRGRTTYQYIPVSQKLSTTYLILNPYVGGDLHAWDFWQKYTVQTQAPVEKEWKGKGNIVVKKLRIDPEKELPVNPNYYQNFIFR